MKSEERQVDEMKFMKNCVFPIVLFLLIAWIGTFRGLRRMNIHYLDELLGYTIAKLRNTVGIGAHRSEEIRRRVSELGYEMKEQEDKYSSELCMIL